MPKTLAPCGTNAAYKRHCRAGEPPCPECKKAHTLYERGRLGIPTNVVILPGMERWKDPAAVKRDASRIDVASELRWLYQNNKIILETAVANGSYEPKDITALSSSLQSVLRDLVAIDAPEEENLADELAARRTNREAGT